MVDERRVRRLLQRISEDLSYLSARASEDPKLLAGDPDRLLALKYVFVTTIEGCLNVARSGRTRTRGPAALRWPSYCTLTC